MSRIAVQFDVLRQDIRYAGRSLRRSPGFSIVAILVVALGIGAGTAAFTVTDFVLIRPLPFPEPERLVRMWETTPGYLRMEMSAPNYRDWKAAATSFESMGVYHAQALTMTDAPEPRRYPGLSVSADLLPTLRVAPLIGRAFTQSDDRPDAPATIILGYQLWQSEFGGDSRIVGRSVAFDNTPFVVVGVMPPEFHFPAADVLFWTTNRFEERNYGPGERTNNWLYAVGRLRRGATLDQARRELDAIAARSRVQYPQDNKDTGAALFRLNDDISERSRVLLLALCGAAACVLLIACANLASLLLVRAIGRRRELAVRAAVGAGGSRLVRQLLTEGLLLAGAGGTLGIGLAFVLVPLLTQLVPPALPLPGVPSVDVRVLLAGVAMTSVTGIGFGLFPILRIAGSPDFDGLREGARSGGGRGERLRSALVAVEIIASMVLLVSTGLLIRALITVQRTDPGFRPEGVLTMRAELPMPGYGRVPTREAFYARVLKDVRALPGVTSACFMSFIPMSSFRGGIWPVSVKGDSETAADTRRFNNVAAIRYVTPGCFETLGIPLARGRDISVADTHDRPFVAVVSKSFVRRYWPAQDPIGRHFTFAFADRVVVGVAGDVRFRGLERDSEPQVYLPSQQVEDGSITFYTPKALAVRTTLPPARLAPSVRAIIRQAEPHVPIIQVQTLADLLTLETASRAVQVRILSVFALIAFILAAIGIHGLLSFAVSQRIPEFGVRRALGAQSHDIVALILGRCVRVSLAGIIPGTALAYAAGRSMEALLAGIKPGDTLTFTSAVTVCAVMTALGSLAPTLRASRADPVAALRTE